MHVKPFALLVAAFLLAGTGLLAIAGDAKDAAIKKDRKALQGTWKTDKDNEAGITSIRFEGEKCVVTFNGDNTASGTYTIDPTQKPKTIDIKVADASKVIGKYKGKVSLGIYQIDGAKLTWHGNEPGAASRPKSLTEKSVTKEEHALIVFEKEKK